MQGFHSTQPPGPGERRLAGSVLLASAVLFAVLLPFASTPLAALPAFVPAYLSALALASVVTAILLAGEARSGGPPGLYTLASGYLFSAALAGLHVFTFPGVFAAAGLANAGPQWSVWLYVLWLAGFPAFVIAYAVADADSGTPPVAGMPFMAAVLPIVVAVAGLALLALPGQSLLPTLVDDAAYTHTMEAAGAVGVLLCAGALVLLWRRRPLTVLDTWLMVAVAAWLFGIALSAILNKARFDAGFYSGRLFGLLSGLLVFAVLLRDQHRLVAELAQTARAERAQRARAEAAARELDELRCAMEERVHARAAELEADSRDLREVALAAATAREQQRTRTAWELREELAQRLSALKMDVAWLADGRLADDPAVRSRLVGMLQLLDGTVAAARRLASEMRPLMLDDLGFSAAAESLVEGFTQRHGIPCRFVMHPPALELPEPAATAVFRIMQEALDNVARHAAAARAEVELRGFRDEVFLRVADDGRGFDPAAPRSEGAFGLVALREHVYVVRGRIRIDSRPGGGTTIEVWVPLAGA